MANVMDQFEVKILIPIEVGEVDLSFTNASLWMGITTMIIIVFFHIALKRKDVIPGRLQVAAEILYTAISNTLKSTAGSKARAFFPAIFSLFLFILIGNTLALLPGSFSFTAHIAVTFFMAFTVFVIATLLGFYKHGMKYFSFFLPKGVPLVLSPLIIIIELVSYLSRPISLSVRLFANIVVGHVLLKVIAGFVVTLGIFGIFPLLAMVSIFALEFLVAVLQAYVFTILTCIYLNDALELH